MLTPDEIRVKEFLPSLRGYDADEVRAFLNAIASAIEAERANPPVPAQAVAAQPELASRVVRLTEELELALWTMRRLESAVQRLEQRLDRLGGPETLAG